MAQAVDELPFGFGWMEERMPFRTAHALADGQDVWLLDPFDGGAEVEERLSGLGKPRGVVQLLDRHDRDCAAFAERLGVPHYRVPMREVPGSPFQPVPVVRLRWWREIALWWPERRLLAAADALGTAPYFRAGGEPLGVHPLLRVAPPRRLAAFEPVHILSGHGAGVHGKEAAEALREALATARRRLPQAWLSGIRASSRS